MRKSYCNGCEGKHELRYGRTIKHDGSTEENRMLGFVKCTENGKTYLATIADREVFPKKPDNVEFMEGL